VEFFLTVSEADTFFPPPGELALSEAKGVHTGEPEKTCPGRLPRTRSGVRPGVKNELFEIWRNLADATLPAPSITGVGMQVHVFRDWDGTGDDTPSDKLLGGC